MQNEESGVWCYGLEDMTSYMSGDMPWEMWRILYVWRYGLEDMKVICVKIWKRYIVEIWKVIYVEIQHGRNKEHINLEDRLEMCHSSDTQEKNIPHWRQYWKHMENFESLQYTKSSCSNNQVSTRTCLFDLDFN